MSGSVEMRAELLDGHPRVQQMAQVLDADERTWAWYARQREHAQLDLLARAVVGTLAKVWAAARELAPEGFLAEGTLATIDEIAGMPGFARAMQAVGWLEVRLDGVQFPNWEEHNAIKGKKLTAAQMAAFERFYAAYPKKRAKAVARERWKTLSPDRALIEELMKALEIQKQSRQWLEGIVPNPATWLSEERWKDQLGPEQAASTAARLEKTRRETAERRERETRAGVEELQSILDKARKRRGADAT